MGPRGWRVAHAISFIAQMFSRLEDKGRINANDHQEGIRRLRVVNKIEALDNCDVIIESVTENYLVKKDIFNRLDSIVSKDTILTSNTSSISITKIATNSSYPGRVAGFHFFNPVLRRRPSAPTSATSSSPRRRNRA